MTAFDVRYYLIVIIVLYTMANITDLDKITGVYRPQVDLFNELIERVNKATTSNKSLMTVLNNKFETSLGGKFNYDEETGEWSWVQNTTGD